MTMHFLTFKNECACNKGLKNVAKSNTWKFVTCKLCKKNDEFKQAKQLSEENDHPNFRKALKDKIDMKLEVTPAESERIQEICFSEGVEWGHGGAVVNFTNFPELGIRSLFLGSRYSICHTPNNDNYKQFSFKDDCFVDEIEKSACGKTLDEFLKACNDDCSNVECFVSKKELIDNPEDWHHSGWNPMGRFTTKRDITILLKTYNLEDYRIKSIPSIAKQQEDGWNGKAIKEASFEPKQYTISEDQMNEICNLLTQGIVCMLPFTKDVEAWKAQAINLKTNSLTMIQSLINKIKGV